MTTNPSKHRDYLYALRAKYKGYEKEEKPEGFIGTAHLHIRTTGWEDAFDQAGELLPGGREAWNLEITTIHEILP